MSGAVMVLNTSGSGFLATAAPTTLSGVKVGTGTVYTSGPSAVTVQGGQAPYVYTWTRVSGSLSVFPQVASSYSTRFYCNFVSAGSQSAVYKCVVEDANLVTVDSNTVSITISSV